MLTARRFGILAWASGVCLAGCGADSRAPPVDREHQVGHGSLPSSMTKAV